MLEDLEKLRIKVRNKMILSTLIIVIIFIICVLIAPSISDDAKINMRISLESFIFAGPFIIVLSIIVSALLTKKDRKTFSDMYKKEIVLTTFNKICTDVKFNLNNGIPRSVIASTEMMRMGDVYSSNDYISGKYKNINFEMADVHIEEEYTDSDGDTSYVTIFRGQWFIFDFNKTFKANIQVCESSFRNAKRKNLFKKQEDKFKKVELEDIDFNKIFKVYAQNELDAFYVLTPNTMEKIKEANNKIKGHLLLCFIDNKLHIGLYNNKDLFEPSIFKKINLEEAINKTMEEISIITNFVDILSLDNDLFKF